MTLAHSGQLQVMNVGSRPGNMKLVMLPVVLVAGNTFRFCKSSFLRLRNLTQAVELATPFLPQ